MKIEKDKTYLTRDKHNVRIICTDRIGRLPIVGLIYDENTMHEELELFTEDGKHWDRIRGGEYDLIEIIS